MVQVSIKTPPLSCRPDLSTDTSANISQQNICQWHDDHAHKGAEELLHFRTATSCNEKANKFVLARSFIRSFIHSFRRQILVSRCCSLCQGSESVQTLELFGPLNTRGFISVMSLLGFGQVWKFFLKVRNQTTAQPDGNLLENRGSRLACKLDLVGMWRLTGPNVASGRILSEEAWGTVRQLKSICDVKNKRKGMFFHARLLI